MSRLAGLDDLDVAGRRVLLRCDLNVPLDGTTITDDGRIKAALATIEVLGSRGARVVVLAHLGRPKGGPTPQNTSELSLAPVAARLGELLGGAIAMATDVTGPSARATIRALCDGDIAMLENVRFDARETSKNRGERLGLATELAALGDCYVGDGFGVLHRNQASVTELAELLPHAAGLLVERETAVFAALLANPDRPYTVVLGGSKVSDKLGVIKNLLPRVDRLLIGGGMCFTFLAALGHQIGASLCEADNLDTVRGFLRQATAQGVELVLPTDVVVAQEISADAKSRVVNIDQGIAEGWMGLDIGPESASTFSRLVQTSRTVVWNGPMGVFEIPQFAAGTQAVAQALTRVYGTSVVGGGDSAAAIRLLGIDESAISHISTGGGASLEFLEGATLPGLAVLRTD